MAERHEPTTCFVLPDGMGLGGVTTWSCQMASMLASAGRPACVLEHINVEEPWHEPTAGRLHRMRLRARHPGSARPSDVPTYLPTYLATLPATLVPNYTEGAYATVAMAAQTDAAQMRVLAFAHADQDYYYSLLARYERIATLLVAVSDEIAAQLAERLPHRKKDIRTRPYGVDCGGTLDRTWSAVGKPLRVAYAGRLAQPQKRILDLPLLAMHLAARKVDFLLDVVGAGDDEAPLRKSCQELPESVSSRIRFLGRIAASEMRDYWKTVDVSLLLSAFEGTSISMLESMAAGCVPVVTRVSGTRRAIQEGINGFAHEIGDMSSIAFSIARLASDRTRLAQMGTAAHAQAAREFPLQDYSRWLHGLTVEAWRMAPRPWPPGLDVFCHPRLENVPDLVPSRPRISITRFARKAIARLQSWRAAQ